MKFLKLFFIITIPFNLIAQETSNSKAGEFELGMRNTISTFNSTGNAGVGFGGQFRIRLGNRINTEWFADFIAEDIEGLAKRNDHHIGWSVMFYPFNPSGKKVVPYILAGHCFDYTKISPVINYYDQDYQNDASRLSSATQAGLGLHIYIADNFNLSVSSQYMIHLGNDIHTEIYEHNGHKEIHIEQHDANESLSLEGHLLFTISLNYKIADLW